MSRYSFCVMPLLMWVPLAVPLDSYAQEKTKTFPVQKCRFTLPGDEWEWTEPNGIPDVVFSATGPRDLTVLCAAYTLPRGFSTIHAEFIKGFENSFFQAGHKKRNAAITTFRGLPAYRADGVFAEGKTSSGHAILADQIGYNFLIIGGNIPVEKDPDYRKILDSFAIDAPPPVSLTPTNISYQLGRVVGTCLGAIILVFVFRAIIGRKKQSDRRE